MEKYFNFFIAFFAFVLFANCDLNEVEIDIPISAVNKVEIKTISIDEFSNDASNFRIYEAISNHIEKPGDIKKSGGSKKITILTDDIKVLAKNEVLTYTFRIEEPTSKSSLFENLIIHKFPDGTFQFAITKFKKGRNNSKFPYKIKYKKIKQNKIDNLDELNVILKSQQQPCYEPVFYICRVNHVGLHDSAEIWIDDNYHGMCGGTDVGFEQVDCDTLEPLDGGSNTGDGWGGFGDSNEPGYNSGNNGGGNNHTPSGYNPSGPILTPPCGDPTHGCDLIQNQTKNIINNFDNPVTSDPIELYLIAKYNFSELLDISVFQTAHIQNNIEVGEYTLTPHFDKSASLIFYAAARIDGKNLGIEYIIKANALDDFREKIGLYTIAANWFYNGGIPSEAQIALAAGDYWEGLSQMWSDAIHSPEWWAYTITSIGHLTISNKVPKFDNNISTFTNNFLNDTRLGMMVGKLREARKKTGNFGMGAATKAEAEIMGKSWVGTEFRESSSAPGVFISKDKLKQYRTPKFKPNLNKTQANFEWRPNPNGQWINNGHLDIIN